MKERLLACEMIPDFGEARSLFYLEKKMDEESYEKFRGNLLEFIFGLPDVSSLKDNREQIRATFQPFLDSISASSEKERRVFVQTTKNIMVSVRYGWYQLKKEEVNRSIYKAYQDARSQVRTNLDLEKPKAEPEIKEETRGRKKVPFHGKIIKQLLDEDKNIIPNLAKLLYAYYDDACPDKDYTKPREIYIGRGILAGRLGVTSKYIKILDDILIEEGYIVKKLNPGKTSATILYSEKIPHTILLKAFRKHSATRKPEEVEAQKRNLIKKFTKLFNKLDKGEIPE